MQREAERIPAALGRWRTDLPDRYPPTPMGGRHLPVQGTALRTRLQRGTDTCEWLGPRSYVVRFFRARIHAGVAADPNIGIPAADAGRCSSKYEYRDRVGQWYWERTSRPGEKTQTQEARLTKAA